MSLSVTEETKNNLSTTNESKSAGATWATTGDRAYEDISISDTWAVPGLFFDYDEQNTLNISNESKN